MSTPSPTSRFLTAAEAAECIGITKSTMYDWVNRGYLPHHRLGRIVRIQASDLEAFIQETRMNRHAGPAELNAQKQHLKQPPQD